LTAIHALAPWLHSEAWLPDAIICKPESPFSAPVPEIVSFPEAGFEAKRTSATKKPAFEGEKPGDLLLS
jgi:hypothetical protein